MTGDATPRSMEILRLLGARPAVPYREDGVRKAITETLDHADIEFETNRYGNAIACIRTGEERRPSIAFVAHMDHPGFELTEAESTNARHTSAFVLGPKPKRTACSDPDQSAATSARIAFNRSTFS